MNVKKSVTGVALDPNEVAIPCGVAAKYFFNDIYQLKDENGNDIILHETGIAWESDQEYVFNNENLSK